MPKWKKFQEKLGGIRSKKKGEMTSNKLVLSSITRYSFG